MRLLTLLSEAGQDVSGFIALGEFGIFAVQTRYEEGLAAPDAPLDRPAAVATVRLQLERVERHVPAATSKK